MSLLIDRWQKIRTRIDRAAEKTGRSPAGIQLVAVSKTHPAEAVREVFDGGQQIFGENRVQELLTKAPLLPEAVQWHLIGHLQKNKIRKVLPRTSLIHGVDSLELARAIDRIAGECQLVAQVLLEVNISGETSKHGFAPDQLRVDINELLALPHLRVQGLMTIAPYVEDPETVRPVFSGLRTLRDQLADHTGTSLPELSMGMSGDFEIAIEEGATLVRVGSAIFGQRPAPP